MEAKIGGQREQEIRVKRKDSKYNTIKAEK
jgi:hypothetical protein